MEPRPALCIENKYSYPKSLKKIREIFFSNFSPEICHKHFCREVQLVKLHQRLLVIGYSQGKQSLSERVNNISHMFVCFVCSFMQMKIINCIILYCHKEKSIACLAIGYNTLPVCTKKPTAGSVFQYETKGYRPPLEVS